MSIGMKQLGSDIKIVAAKKLLALEAIKLLPGKERNLDLEPHNHFHGADYTELEWDTRGNVTKFRYFFMDVNTTEEALESWSWHPEMDGDGNITKLTFMALNEGDYDILFRQIAPFVEPGSWIEMANDEGFHYLYFFNGIKVKYVRLNELNDEEMDKLFGSHLWHKD